MRVPRNHSHGEQINHVPQTLTRAGRAHGDAKMVRDGENAPINPGALDPY